MAAMGFESIPTPTRDTLWHRGRDNP